jgi:hypothetical protein
MILWDHAHALKRSCWPWSGRRCAGFDEECGCLCRSGRNEKRGCLCRAVSGWFVLMAVTRHERCSSQLGSGLAESSSLAMKACCHLVFRWVELLDQTLALRSRVSYSLPASLARSNAARRCYSPRWLARRQDSRRLALRAKLLCGSFP